ncbi:MAG TPA: dihydrodipicolinate synthase family protein [Candidatus Dormibacteraeota bacterium]
MASIDSLAGVLVALASPVHRDGTVDRDGIGRLVEHVLDGGVSGVLALGSTGETASLDDKARRQVLESVMDATRGRVPVLCGVARTELSTALAEVEAATRAGAGAALVAAPYYYPTDQAGVLAFYRAIAERATIPIFVYNIPPFTKVVVEPATVATLAREGAIQGIKDSSRDFEYFEGVCIATRDMPAFRVFTGSDTMLVASLAAGGDGTICGAANVAPRWVVRVYEEFMRGDITAARDDQEKLYQLVMAVRAGVFPSAIKAALHLQGICEPWTAPPSRKLDDASESRLRQFLAGAQLLPD